MSATDGSYRQRRGLARRLLLLDLVDEFEVELEQAAEELLDERVLLGFLQTCRELRDLPAQGSDALPRRLRADEVGDQEPDEDVALERSQLGRRRRVLP